ncbi:DNRLRE domain-containing protein [Aphelenchoides fujianensis]|nr:DNRLRE domain-containing protein [Aphelenchoides fujianensis]
MIVACLFLLLPLAAHSFNLTKYPVPNRNLEPPYDQVLNVSLDGDDANTGTQGVPLRNLRTAIERAESGVRIVMRGGLYYNISLGAISKPVLIQAFPHEQVYLLGSVPVDGWTKRGANWAVEWNNPFAAYQPDAACTQMDDTGFKCRPEQVFVGGEPLVQVGAESDVKAGTFFVDNAAGRLLIGSDPTGRTVEVSVQERAVSLGSTASIDGIGFAHYGSHLGHGAVIANGQHSSFYFCSFVQNAGDAVMLNGSYHVVQSSVINYNGWRGIYGKSATGSLLLSNTVNFNFARAPNFAACTGDSCLLAAANIGNAIEASFRVDSNRFESNGANGLRVTVDYPASVIRNIARGNTLAGFVFAHANDSVFASNVAVGNAIGMPVISCPEAFVYNNDLVGNEQGLIVTATPPMKNALVRVRNNLFSNNLERQLSVWAASEADLAATFGILDHNGYFQRNASGTRPFAWGNQTFVYHDGFVAASGFDKAPPSIDIRNQAAQPFFVNEAAGNFNLRANSVAVNAGAALPTRISRELNVKSSPVNMGALQWPGQ